MMLFRWHGVHQPAPCVLESCSHAPWLRPGHQKITVMNLTASSFSLTSEGGSCGGGGGRAEATEATGGRGCSRSKP
jgi:hypothetical protein